MSERLVCIYVNFRSNQAFKTVINSYYGTDESFFSFVMQYLTGR